MVIPCAEVCTRACGKTPNTMMPQCSHNDVVYDVMASYSRGDNRYMPGSLSFEGTAEFGGRSQGTLSCDMVGGVDSCTAPPRPGPPSCDDAPTVLVSGCSGTSYGCCPDKSTPSEMPKYEYQSGKNHQNGCQKRNACAQTEWGCCRDGVATATGPGFQGCSVGGCEGTEFGCCPGQKVAARTADKSDCCRPTSGCGVTEFGCCTDGITPAASANGANCNATTTGGCHGTEYGCCPDKITAAAGIGPRGEKICDVFDELITKARAEDPFRTTRAIHYTRRHMQMQSNSPTNRFLSIY